MREINSDTIEVNVLVEAYRGDVLIKKDILLKKTIRTQDIISVEEILNQKGKARITRCAIELKDGSKMNILANYNKVKDRVHPQYNQIGFKI